MSSIRRIVDIETSPSESGDEWSFVGLKPGVNERGVRLSAFIVLDLMFFDDQHSCAVNSDRNGAERFIG